MLIKSLEFASLALLLSVSAEAGSRQLTCNGIVDRSTDICNMIGE